MNVGVFVAVLAGFQYRLHRKLKLKLRWDQDVIKRSYALGFKAFLSEYVIILLMRVDLLILKQLGSFTQVGIYTLAVNFVDVINISCNTIGTVLLAKLTSLQDDHEALSIMRRIFLMIVIFNLLAVLGMVIFGFWIIKYMYGEAYQDAYLAFVLLIPAVFGVTLGPCSTPSSGAKASPFLRSLHRLFLLLSKPD